LQVEGVGVPFYARTEDFEREAASGGLEDSTASKASILAPLDNLLWDRRMIKQLFGFEYTWEVYKPAEQRSYGYYVLPVLYGDRFVARFEPGRDKETGRIVVKNWWWEPDAAPDADMKAAIRACFCRFQRFLGSGGVLVEPKLAKREGLSGLFGKAK
jgi:uncharacterized protein YcaQ